MTIAAGLELPEAEIAELCRCYQAKELAAFGSAVRGELASGEATLICWSTSCLGLGRAFLACLP